MAVLNISRSQIVGLSMESLTYGMYCILFLACMSVFWTRYSGGQPISYSFFWSSIVLYLLITAHLVMDIVRTMQAFGQNSVADADNYYLQFQSTLSVVKTSINIVVTWIFDALMVSSASDSDLVGFFIHTGQLYRCFVVWNKRWSIITLPILLLLADIGSGISLVIVLAHPEDGASVFEGSQAKTVKSFFAMTFITNGLCAGLIAYKLWVTQRELADSLRDSQKRPISLNRIWIIILESGSIYWVTLVLTLAVYESQAGYASLIFLDITSPITGMVFALIIVRVSIGFKPDGTRGELASSILFASQAHARSRGVVNMNETFSLSGPTPRSLVSRPPIRTTDSDLTDDFQHTNEHVKGSDMQMTFVNNSNCDH
ncbi:hypothetical protein AMATHDRAFT_43879 [Amanita thiersii Skay4041]|uniref:Uncharacterized protein n=1 Tax=Amanita thiersii Skay4041 TaxID=703135 RepID=A0A2A9N886_9AGAR|nr:hypothetical protein AMATHDRAFT_43879 [Amanita thiersii Skay4041]